MNYVMYYDYDKYYDAYQDVPQAPNGTVFEILGCRVLLKCVDEPEIMFWVDGGKYSKEQAAEIFKRVSKILTYIFALPLYCKDFTIYEDEDILEINDLLPEAFAQKIQYIEKAVLSLGKKEECFNKAITQLAIAFDNLFKEYHEEAFFFFYKVVELISKEYYQLNKAKISDKKQDKTDKIETFLDKFIVNNIGVDIEYSRLKELAQYFNNSIIKKFEKEIVSV